MNLFYHSVENRKLCCGVRKMEPLRRALSGLDAWITGLRREQSVTRTAVHKVEWDEGNALVKVNPLVDWSHDDVWKYIRDAQRAVQRAARSRVSQHRMRAVHARRPAGRARARRTLVVGASGDEGVRAACQSAVEGRESSSRESSRESTVESHRIHSASQRPALKTACLYFQFS